MKTNQILFQLIKLLQFMLVLVLFICGSLPTADNVFFHLDPLDLYLDFQTNPKVLYEIQFLHELV